MDQHERQRRIRRALRLTPEGQKLLAFGRELQEQRDTFFSELQGRTAVDVITLAAGDLTLKLRGRSYSERVLALERAITSKVSARP